VGWEAIVHPDDREKMSKYFSEEVVGQGKSFDMEYRILRISDQVERWVHGRGKLETDPNGNPVKMHGAIQDITDRKRHEHELEGEALLAQALSEKFELQPLLEQLLIAACHAIQTGEKGTLALMTDDNHLEVRAANGYQHSKLQGFAYSISWGFGGRAIRQRRPILIENIELDAALRADTNASNVDEIRGLRSAIAVPLLIHETAIGVLSLESSRPGAFNENDLRLLVNFATSAALIIERARLFDETRRHATESATLLQTSLALTDLDLESTLQTIGTHASALFETDACRIFLTDEAEEDTLRCVLALGENQSALIGLKVRLGQGVTGDVAAKGQAEIVNNMGKDPRAMQIPGTPEEEESIMFAPLKSGEQVIGVMSVKRLGLHRPFTPSDLELLKAFASMSASAVSNARLFEETRQRLSELTTIHQTAQRLTQLHTPDMLAQEIVNILEETLHYEHGAVMLISRDGKRLEPFALSDQAYGVNVREQDKASTEGLSIQMGRGITGWVAEHGQSVRLGDASHDPRYLAAREGIQSELCVPLRIGERVIGIVNVESRRPNSYSESDQRVLETIAAQFAISINNADLFEGTRQQVTELEMLYESGMELSQTLSPKEIGERVIELLEQKMGWRHVTVRLHHPQDDTFELLAFNQPGLDSDAERREVGRNFSALVPGPGKGLSGWAFQNSQNVRCGNVQDDPRYVDTNPNLKSGLYVPIRSGQKVIGVLSIESEQPNAFSEADERLAATLSNQAASALENARLFEEVRQRVAKLETINRVSIALRAITNHKAILAIVLEEILKALNLTVGSIRIWHPETHDLRQEAARGWTAELGQESIKAGEGIVGKVFESGETYISREFHNDPLTLPRTRHKMPKNWGGVCTSIRSSEEPLGVLLIAAPSSREFNKEEVRLLNTLAEMTGAALHRMNLLNETIRRAREFESLYETSRVISAEADLNSLLEIIVKSAIEMLGATGGGMYLYDVADQEVEVVVAAHISVPLGARLKLGEGLAGRVAQTREPMRIEDYATWEGRSLKFEGLPIRAALEVPILYGGELIGVLVAEETGDSTRKFSEADERLLTLFASQAAGAIKSARLHDETIHRLKQLQALRVIDRAIAGSLDKRVTLNILVDQIISQLDADAADVLLLNPYLQTLQFAAGHGFRTRLNDSTELHMGASFAGRAVLERHIQRVQDTATASRNPDFYQFWNHEGFSSYHAVPLIAKGQVIGVIEVFHRAAFQPDLEWINFLETLADQTAIALDNAQMFENVQNVNMELSLAYEATIEGWSRAMDLRDEETEGHTQRVAEMAVTLARVMGFDGEELLHVRRGALLHDIGKIGVPDHILHKKDDLTEEEWQIMRQHPKFAYEMLLPISYLRQSLDIPYKHHERWDGSGYPQGLAGDHIPLSARIFAVVDVYDALTSDRPYRNAWTHEQTIQYIREHSGKHFDPFVVEKFIDVFGEKNT
jgi:putative nucleotidyltransferase with HDIG domain